MTVLETERLLLRPWHVDDVDEAQALYRYASNPHIGPACGWMAHTSVENSMEIIRDGLSDPETYAVVLRHTDEPIGSIGLAPLSDTIDPEHREPENTRELGYWIAEPFWGQGLIPEAGREMLRHGFEDLHLSAIWGDHNLENHKSERVMDKLGLRHIRVAEHEQLKQLGEVYRDMAVRCITAEQWAAGKA